MLDPAQVEPDATLALETFSQPTMSGFAARGEHREPPWATELMEGYW